MSEAGKEMRKSINQPCLVSGLCYDISLHTHEKTAQTNNGAFLPRNCCLLFSRAQMGRPKGRWDGRDRCDGAAGG